MTKYHTRTWRKRPSKPEDNGLKEKDSYISYLEDEVTALEKKEKNLVTMVEVLSAENKALKEQSQKTRSLASDKVAEYYEGEVDYVILRALYLARKQLNGTGCDRQLDVLNELIEGYEKGSDALVGKAYVKSMKRLAKNENSNFQSVLTNMGFNKARANGHLIYYWNEDSRYVETVSCTPSDNRHHQNLIHDICRKIYGMD